MLRIGLMMCIASVAGAIIDCPGADVGPEGDFQMAVSGAARYVRITATKRADAMTIAEVRIWGFNR